MAVTQDTPKKRPFDGPPPQGVDNITLVALGATILWLVLTGIYFLSGRDESTDGLRFLMAAMVIVLPVALIWLAALTMRMSRMVQSEMARLRSAIDAIRNAYVAQSKAQAGARDPAHPALVKRLDEIAASQKALEGTLVRMGSGRMAEAAIAAPELPMLEAEEQQALSLGTPAEAMQPPLSNEDFVRALNFPETAEDKEGFAALRRALKDRQVAQLVQASQDVLTLLSQDGVYMDDLRPDLPRPELWRAFAKGSRGRVVGALGGIHDRASLALAAGRMKEDQIFRDAVLHFLRHFDTCFADFAGRASDAELGEFAFTRTARAFMLLGRVAGTFD